MRSLYYRVLLAMGAVLVLAFLGFQAISERVLSMTLNPIFEGIDELELESVRELLSTQGPAATTHYLSRLDHLFGGTHLLLDAQGRDAVTGGDWSALLPPAPATKSRTRWNGQFLVTHQAADGQYWFAALAPLRGAQIWTFAPYYLLVLGATGTLGWLAAFGLVRPIRRIATTVADFGDGDLTARVTVTRQDEIGDLAQSFNRMAGRLERLITSERRLLEDISHELRSPLARLKVAVKLARTSSDPARALDRVERDVDRIASLVADVLEITGIEDDPAAQKLATVQLGSMIEELVSDCSIEAEQRGCDIELAGSLDVAVIGNRELLRRAIENVLRNAIRYSPGHSTICLEVAAAGSAVTITIRDYGPGVPDNCLGRLFDPFFRVEAARHANGGGSGLGLSIARRAVQLHHGQIFAENARPGLRVRIVLPC